MSEPEIFDRDVAAALATEGEQNSVSHLSLVDNAEPQLSPYEAAVIGRLDHLIALVNDARNGVGATYAGVAQILQLLAGVQQVAAMMPGKIGKAVREMASNPPNGVSQ